MASSLLKSSGICSDSSCLAGFKYVRPRPKWTPTFSSKIPLGSPVISSRGIVSMAAEFKETPVAPDSQVQEGIPRPEVSGSKVVLPPRICTLREFGEGMVAVESNEKVPSFFDLLAANIEFSYDVQNWEILSGRLAMIVFASAVLLEAITGNSVFEKMDPQRLFEIFGAIFASVLIAAGFAVALQAKTRVAYSVSKGYEYMMNALIDNVFDSLLFDTEDP